MRTRKRIVSLLLAVVMIFGSLGNSIIAETIPSDTLTEPMATETSLEIEQDQPHETEPLPTEPAPTEPAPTEPAPTEPAPTEPAATEPAATEPLVTEPLPTEPQATESEANDPVVTEPAKEAPLETKAPEAEETKPELLKDLYIFYVDGVEAGRQDVTHGDLLEFPELESREPDFIFEGWFIAGFDTSLDPTKPIAVDTGGQVIEVRAVFTKVEPEPIDEEAYGPQVPYAPVLLPGSMSRITRSFSTMAAASTHEVDASTPDASLAAGQFKLSKSAALVPGKVNEWDVTLRVTGRQSETYSDIVLVIDRSGSMAGNKLTQAKAAANLFIDTVLSMPNTRIAVVSYSDSIARHGSAPYFSSNAATLKGYVNSLSANGFTHTQGGLRAAREILGNHALSGARKTIVLLSDGLPNRSYEGSGSAAVTAAIGEANAARSNGYSVYAIGLMLDASGQSTMMSIGDTGKYYYTDNPANLTPIFLAIAGNISSAVTAATVTDPMASGFIIADTGTITKTGASSTANYGSGTLTWTFPSLTQPTGTVNVLYEEVKYRIVITEDTPFASGSMPANGATPMNFTDASGASSTNYFPIPEVDPVFVTLDKILLDVNGESVSSTESFTVNVGGKDYAVTPNDPVKVIKKVWTIGEHDVSEDPSDPPYITSMTVNGLPAGGSPTVKINMSQGGPDQDVVVTNRENVAKITFGGTKTLSGRTGTTPADTFDFTLSGEAGAKMPAQTTASLMFNGNGTKDFSFGDVIYNLNDLAGENSKTFTYTIAETVPNPGIPGIVYDANPSRTVTVTLSKDLQTGILSATATPDVKFANRYQAAGSIVLTTKKVLDGRPLEAGDFTFQLKTGNLVLQTKTNAADGSVEFDPIQFSLSAVNMTFDYTIEEVAGTETGMSYDPLPITVSVEVTDPGDGILEVTPTYSNKKTFSNTYEAAGEVILSAIKLLEGRDLTAGAFTFKLMEGANELQTKTNAADGSITFDKLEFTEADIGETFTYNIVEVAGSEAGMTYDPLVLSVSIQVTDAGNGNLLVVPTYSPTDKTFRNRYESPRINITGNKVWEDGPQDRPDIWFKLYRQIGDGVAEAVPGIDALQIPDTAPFTVTWMGVAEKNTEGVAYTFSVREGIWNEGAQVFTLGAPSGYEIAAGQDPLEITNRYIIPKDDVTATKVWEDGPSDRPDIWFKLYRQIGDGAAEAVPGADPKQIPAAAPFTVTWTDIEQENSDGAAYTFSVKEGLYDGVDFSEAIPIEYEIVAGQNPLEITNRYIIPKDDVTATKVWEDGPSDRPDVWFKLYRQAGMGAEEAVPGIDPQQIPDTEPFTVQWTDVEMENSAGDAYTFFVKEGIYDGTDFTEGAPSGYEVAAGQDPLEITNRYIIPKDDVTATKVWEDGPSDRPDVWFKLYRQIGEGVAEAVPGIDPLQIPAAAPFTVTWTDLEQENSAGVAYTFSVREGTWNEGTQVFALGAPTGYEIEAGEDPLEITNRYIIPKDDVTATKVWQDGPSDRPDVWFKLYRQVGMGAEEAVPGIDPQQLPDTEPFTVQWTDVDMENSAGEAYTFFVKEGIYDGTDFTEGAPTGYQIVAGQNPLEIINRYIIPKDDVTATKVWVNGPSDRPDIWFKLYRQMGEGAEEAVPGIDALQIPATAPFTVTWTDVELETSAGEAYLFSVKEGIYDGTDFVEGVPEDYELSLNGLPLTLTNSYVIPLADVTANKQWADDFDDHPSIWFKLYRAISGGDPEEVPGAGLKMLAGGETSATWTDLEQTDIDGNPYTFSVEEVDEDGVPMAPENYEKTEDGLTVQNSLIDPIGRLTVTKALLDNSGTNGGEGAADATLGEQLTFEFKVTGPYGFETLFELAPGDSHVLSELFYGEYVVEELTSHGYVTTYGADGGVAVLTEEVPEADVVVENLHLTDPDDDPNLVTVDATKTWIGGPESDHEQIVLTLYRRSGEDGSVLAVAASVVVSPDESVDGKYTYTWEDLPKHDAKGYLYTYTVEESDLISGALIIEDRAYVASREGNDFTNAFNVPSQIWKLVNDSEEHSLTALDEIFHYHIMVSIPQYVTSETKFVIEDQMLDVFLPLSAAVEVDGVDITSRGILELDWVGKHLRFQFKDGEDISDLAGKTIQLTTETRLDLTKDLRPHYGVPIPNVATLQFTSGYPERPVLFSLFAAAAEAESDAPQLLYSNVVYVNLPEIEISIAADKSVDRVTDSSQMIRTDGIFRAVGDEIYYQFNIENTGDLPFTSLAIKDAKLGLDVVVDLSDTPLLPGDTYTYEPEAPYAVTSEDLDAETILNEATVTGTTPSGPTDPVPVEHETPGAAERRITAVKTAVRVTDVSDAERADNVFTAVGDKIYYRFEIVNEGTVSLTGLTVADEKLGLNVSLDLSGSPLLPGESYIYEPAAPYVVTAADLEAETVLNTATIAGTTPHGSTDPVLVEEETSGLAVRSIAAEKTAVRVTDLSGATRPDVVITDAGQGVYYRFEITNTGSVPLTGLSIADPKIGLNVDLDLTETPLLPGESYTYEPAAPYVVTAADMAEGMVINQATIIGLTPGGTTDPVLAEALTPAARSTPPPVDVPKTGEPQTTLPFAGLALLLGAAVTLLISRKRRQDN